MQAVQAAAEEVENIPWDQLTTEAANQIKIPTPLLPQLPGAKLAVVVSEESAPVANKRIQLVLTWNTRSGHSAAPIRFTAWAFPDRPMASEK